MQSCAFYIYDVNVVITANSTYVLPNYGECVTETCRINTVNAFN